MTLYPSEVVVCHEYPPPAEVPLGEKITNIERDRAPVTPKWDAALRASVIRSSPGCAGAGLDESTQVPPNTLPAAGYGMCAALLGQLNVPAGTPLQYWVRIRDHVSPFVPRPLKKPSFWDWTPPPLPPHCEP